MRPEAAPMHLRQVLTSAFDLPLFEPALFYRQPGGLRFELSEGGRGVMQFLQAMDKARVLCGDLFPDGDDLVVCLRIARPGSPWSLRPVLRALRAVGLRWPRERCLWREAWVQEDERPEEDPGWAWMLAFRAGRQDLWPLLWCALAVDFPSIQPNPGCELHLFNLTRGIRAHPYDDRGMDVVGRNPAFLAGLYRRHQRWLLDFDRAAMAATFDQPDARL